MSPPGGSSQKPIESSNPAIATDGPKPGVGEQIVVLRDLLKGGIRSNIVRDATDSDRSLSNSAFPFVPRTWLAVNNVAPKDVAPLEILASWFDPSPKNSSKSHRRDDESFL